MRPPPLYVARTTGSIDPLAPDEDQPVHVLSIVELLEARIVNGTDTTAYGSAPPIVKERMPVAAAPRDRFVSIGDAVDNAPDVRDALLGVSPDPALARWNRPDLRAVALLAPMSWGWFVWGDIDGLKKLSDDAARVIDSPAFKEAEASTQNPGLAKEARTRREKIERAIGMRGAYVAAEAAIGLAAVVVVLAGLRRWRAIPVALGFGAAFWWMFQAGRPGHCFGANAFKDHLLAILGLVGAIATIVLAPSETNVVRSLRARLGLPEKQAKGAGWLKGERRLDVAAALAAAAAGLCLPVIMTVLGRIPAGNAVRVLVFVGYCTAFFLGFLGWRRDTSEIPPKLVTLALAASLGFGVLAAADVAVRASFATVVEVQTCVAPNKVTALNKVQQQGSEETTAARKDTQTDFLAFFIAIFAAPLSEEMLYRGTLQRIARKAFGGRNAILLSGIIFGLAHMSAFHAAFYQHIGLGLAFAAIFELAGGGAVAVVASAATHLMWNLWLAEMPVF